MQDDIVQATVKHLIGFPDVLAVLDSFEVDGGSMPGLWQYRLFAQMEGTSGTACVIDSDGGWAGANPHNTLRFPRLMVTIWADPIRDMGSNAVDPGEVQRRAIRAFWAVDARLHRPQGGSQLWGSLRTVDCVRLTEPTMYVVPDGDGLVRCAGYYAITQG